MNDISAVEKSLSEKLPSDYYAVKVVDRRLSRPLIKPSFIVCDVGGGWGIDALPFARLSSFSILLEINRSQLKRGKILATMLGLESRTAFIRGSATDLPFKNEVFDLVSSFSVLDHIPGKDSHHKAIKEMSRATRNFGYVVVTVPNKLFVIGTVTRKIIQLMGNPFLEKHFTPREIRETMISAGLTPLFFDAKYPTKIGDLILNFHLPNFVMKIPDVLLLPFVHFCEKVFGWLEGSFKMLGARMGYACQKRGCARDASTISLIGSSPKP